MKKLAIALALVASTAHAERPFGFYTGVILNEKMQPNAGSKENAHAWGYILGAFDVLADKRLICPPPGLTSDQVLKVMTEWMQYSEDLQPATGGSIAEYVFAAAYPC